MAKILLFGVSTQKDRAVRVAAEKIGVDVTAVNRRDMDRRSEHWRKSAVFIRMEKYITVLICNGNAGVFRNGFATGGCILQNIRQPAYHRLP